MTRVWPISSMTDLSFPFDDLPAPGRTIEVAPGVLWARLPLPMALDHVNVYLVEDDGGWAIVDTGLDTAEARSLWERLLAGRRITRIIVTHQHPDHMGLAGWLVERTGAPLIMTRTAWLYARVVAFELARGVPPAVSTFYRGAGLNEERIRWIEEAPFGAFSMTAPLPATFRRVRAGQELEVGGARWRAVTGDGHAPEHLCLLRTVDSTLLAGDQCLSRITSIIGVFPTEPEEDPLAEWLESCARLQDELPVDALVLPGHGVPFRGLHARLGALIDHHNEALDRLEQFLTEPRTAADCFPVLFPRTIGPGIVHFAAMEAMAHLNHLMALGRVRRIGGVPLRWRASTSKDVGSPRHAR